MPKVHKLTEALQQAGSGKKHALLGNGFSRACRNDIFAYDKLFERADFTNLSISALIAFDILDSSDFEVVMESLISAAKLVRVFAKIK